MTDSEQFGSWFGMKLNGPFKPGQKITGEIRPTTVDEEIAKMQKPYTGKPVELWVDKIIPESSFSIMWHPFAIDPNVDYSGEPKTLITFTLDEKDGGVLFTVTESGFELIPESRREAAMKANDGGWAAQMNLISKFLHKTN